MSETSATSNEQKRYQLVALLDKISVVVKDEFLPKLVEFLNLYYLSVEQLYLEIEAVILSTTSYLADDVGKSRKEQLTASKLALLESKLKDKRTKALKEQAAKKTSQAYPAARSAVTIASSTKKPTIQGATKAFNKDSLSSVLSKIGGISAAKSSSTPAAASVAPRITPIAAPMTALYTKQVDAFSSKLYAEREGSGNVAIHFNKELTEEIAASTTPATYLARIELIPGIGSEPIDTESTKPFTYMYDKPYSKSDAVSDRLLSLGEQLLERYELGYALPLGTVTGSQAVYVGRILTESLSGDYKLNANSILLEGYGDESSRKSVIVKLYLDPSVKHSFFPGQIVAIKGYMKDGKLVVDEVFSDASNSEAARMASTQRSTRMLVAVGPYTTDDNLEFRPLDDLLSVIEKESPDVAVLIGPFVPAEHPLIANNQVDFTYEWIFDFAIEMVRYRLPRTTQFILVPSLDDIHHDYVYPQPPFDSIADYRIHCMPNPCVFSVNGISVGINSFDVIRRLNGMEYASKPYTAFVDRIKQCSLHCLEQRSFCPSLIQNEKLPIDFIHAKDLEMERSPSILVLPSEIMSFAETVQSTLVVNPKQVISHGHPGTYAIINIAPASVAKQPSEDYMDTSEEGYASEAAKPKLEGIAAHTEVKIVKIYHVQ